MSGNDEIRRGKKIVPLGAAPAPGKKPKDLIRFSKKVVERFPIVLHSVIC